MKKILAVLGATTLLIAAGGVSGAEAAHLITSAQIKDGTIRQVDINPSALKAFKAPGPRGAQGPQGVSGDALKGAIYRVENYQNGGGGTATVACADDQATSEKYTAIAGGVQGSEAGSTENQSGFLVSSSFPGRLDYSTNPPYQPKPGRLDGWIILGNSQYTKTLKVWALCVPNTTIKVQQVNLDN